MINDQQPKRRFNLPQNEKVDKVIFAIFCEKFRTLKHGLKKKLFQQATKILNENDGIHEDGEQERQYTDDELLQALDLVEAPNYFTNQQWELYKNNLRTSTAKKLSYYGKKARADQVNAHTTGVVSYARKKDELKLKHKREANRVEFFEISHLTKARSYVKDSSRKLMDQARQGISKKLLEVGGSETIDSEKMSEIERDVMEELMGPDKPGRAFGEGSGVTKSQVSKFSSSLRRVKGESVENENRFLLDKVDSQNKKIAYQSKQIDSQTKQIESQNKQLESQSKQMKIMEQRLDECTGELRLFRNVFADLYGSSHEEVP